MRTGGLDGGIVGGMRNGGGGGGIRNAFFRTPFPFTDIKHQYKHKVGEGLG